MRGTVSFVGAGPGAADLLTLRGAQRIADADLILYPAGVIDAAWLRSHTSAELVDCARLGSEELAEHYRRVAGARARAVRLVTGDPALSTRLRDQLDMCARLGLDVEVVPGVSPISAAAGAVATTLTEAGAPLAVTTVETDFATVRALAGPDRTLAVRAPAARTADLVEALVAAGVRTDTPAVVADKTSRTEETLIRTTVGELVAEVKKHNLWRNTLFLIGEALREGGKPRTQTDEPPRWTTRSWRTRPTDAPRRAWPRRTESDPTAPDSTTTDSTATDSTATDSTATGPAVRDSAPADPVRDPAAEDQAARDSAAPDSAPTAASTPTPIDALFTSPAKPAATGERPDRPGASTQHRSGATDRHAATPDRDAASPDPGQAPAERPQGRAGTSSGAKPTRSQPKRSSRSNAKRTTKKP